MIPFNKPPFVGTEQEYLDKAIKNGKISGDGPFTKLCSQWMEQQFNACRVLLTNSGTAALEMAALLCNLHPGDEVILPSFTFSSTANAFVMAGARLVFVDVRPDTMNIDEEKLIEAITEKTRVICVVHYAGVACEMQRILEVARSRGLLVVEDAAQAVMSTYHGKPLGTLGDFGCYSFHETKNYSMGEGGALVINRPQDIEYAERLWENGTNRAQFVRGEVQRYHWVQYGGNYLPSELNAAHLWAQLEAAKAILHNRLTTWHAYDAALRPLSHGGISLPAVPQGCKHNGHLYYIKCRDMDQREQYLQFMKDNGVQCAFHYVPLHSAPAGKLYGRFCGEDLHTTHGSRCLVRLPLYYGLQAENRDYIAKKTLAFFGEES